MANHIVNRAIAGIGETLSILAEVHDDISQAKALINLLGWELPPGVDDIGLATLDIGDFLEKLDAVLDVSTEELEDEIFMLERVTELMLAVNTLVQTVYTLAQNLPSDLAAFDDYVERTKIHKELPRRLFDFLLTNYFAHSLPLSFAILHLIDVIDYPYFPADPENFQVEHIRAKINYQRFNTLVSNPSQLAEEAYGWGTPTFTVRILLKRLNLLFRTLGIPSRVQPLEPQAEEIWLERTVSETNPMPQLITFFYEDVVAFQTIRLGLSIFGSRATAEGSSDAGLGLVPIVRGQSQGSIRLSRFANTFIEFSAEVEVLKRLALLIRPGQGLDVKTGNGISEAIAGRFALGLRHGTPISELKTLFPLPGGTSLQAQQVYLMGGMDGYPDRPIGFVEMGLLGCRFTFSLEDADGFLQDSIGQKQLAAPCDIVIYWDSERGISLQGNVGLQGTFSLSANLGPIRLDLLHLAVDHQDDGFELEASTSGSLSLGPVMTTVDQIGVAVAISFDGGNLGLFGLSADFKPPKGLAIAIDASVVAGGGYLFFDPEKEQYAGIVQLQFEQLTLTATGLLTTRMPDGSSGFSLLIMLAVEDFQPLQLGLGFKLTGIGGLLGFNRTVAVEVLRRGLKNQTLDRVLFPPDPLKNAPIIVSTLRSVFPPIPDQYVLGPIAQISWGREGLLTANLGIILEFPDPVRFVLLGQMRALFPNKSFPLVRLNLDVLGVIDFDKGEAFLLATLFDSKFYQWEVTGDAAFFLRWKRNPTFILSIGGFHPAYKAPPEIPSLARLSLSLSKSKKLQLRLTWYLALTSNTLQHGARLDLRIKASKFRLDGHLSYDALIQFNPFGFIVLFSAGVGLKWGSRTLASVQLEGALAGPSPWHIKGQAKFKIWRFSKSVSFDRTIGSGETAPPLPVVNAKPALIAALKEVDNWQASLPPASEMLVTFKEEEIDFASIKVHPLGTISVRQTVLPLKTKIEKFGNARTAQKASYTISKLKLGLTEQAIDDLEEFFAPGEYQELTQAEKLSQPSFEQMEAGVKVSSAEDVTYQSEQVRTINMEYESELILPLRRRSPSTTPLPELDLVQEAKVGASAKRRQRQAGVNRFISEMRYEAPELQWQGYAIVNRDDMTVAELELEEGAQAKMAEEGVNYYQAREWLKDYEQVHPRKVSQLQVVPVYELK